MKSKHFIRTICLLLLSIFLFTLASASNQVQPRYQKIALLSSVLSDISYAGRASCCGVVTLSDPSCRVELYVELQQSEDGVNGWSTIKSWTTSGTSSLSIEKYWYVDSGYYYRVLTTAIVYNASGAYIESDMLDSLVTYY